MQADPNSKLIQDALVRYVIENHPTTYTSETLPLDRSLVELGVMDSYGVVELVCFIETNWSIVVADDEITMENMAGINRMTAFIERKLGNQKS